MAVDRAVSRSIIEFELDKCREYADKYGWEISPLDENALSFNVKLTSPIDKESFIVSFRCDNYRELPPYIDFIDPNSGQSGLKKSYPLSSDGFCHQNALICHPCSRKAYRDLNGPHGDWRLVDWERNPKTGALKSIPAILLAIYERISQPGVYRGRMK